MKSFLKKTAHFVTASASSGVKFFSMGSDGSWLSLCPLFVLLRLRTFSWLAEPFEVEPSVSICVSRAEINS